MNEGTIWRHDTAQHSRDGPKNDSFDLSMTWHGWDDMTWSTDTLDKDESSADWGDNATHHNQA
jgi:hypothetical protein